RARAGRAHGGRAARRLRRAALAMGQARLPARPELRNRPRIRDPRHDRVRGPARLRGDRSGHEPRRAAVHRGQGRADPHEPEDPRPRGGRGRCRARRLRRLEGICPARPGVQHSPRARTMKKMLRMLLVAFTSAVVPSAPAQQPARTATIGYLGIAENPELDSAFRKGLEERGYAVGKTVRIEYRSAGGKAENLPRLAAELVALKVAVIVASSSQAIEAARTATKTIPIVLPVTFDPVRSGYVASLARPGGNLTGLNPLNPEVAGKRVELLKEIVPRLSRVAVVWNSTNPGSRLAGQQKEGAAEQVQRA